MESQLRLIQQSLNTRYSIWVREALNDLPDNFTITDPTIAGHPIVFVSRGFLKMTGYSEDEVIGKNGRMFQGPKTSRSSVMQIREAVREEKAIQINLLNYRKDGTPYWVFFQMSPVFSKEDGRIINFVGVQVPIWMKSRKPRCGFVRIEGIPGENEFRACKSLLGSCRRELLSDSISELGRLLNRDSQPDSDSRGIEEPCEACDDEKQRAAIAICNILSVLTHHSEVTGRLVCERRCSVPGVGIICSSLNTSLNRIKQSFVLTDPHLPDMPIVYASDEFLKVTGYTRCEVLGRNCRFLSGVDTDTSSLFKIKESIQSEQACTVRILNYRKNKSSFWNHLHISPVRNASGKVAYFVGVQMDEDDKMLDEHGVNPKRRQLSTVGAVKVAVRSLSMSVGCSQED
ncbi:protein TWIN LOV 1 isoform X2 [Momordica charantia]|uniref:Protein TWIN LOV 1 isoform X2 n=1 Tax=Momordica charantia TaxID=3673 RepID=A0A6J1DC37_MOMCH|nr:protein TWIN LOV 1 isoform X2 [Momordica charantia]